MALNIDGIVKCTIDINSPAVSGESYSGLLIVGPPPSSKTMPDVASYTSIEAVSTAGYADTDPVYLAAVVAFSQSLQPDRIYVATIQDSEEPTDAVERALGTDGWYFICPVGIETTKYNALSVYVETLEKLLMVTLDDEDDSPFLQEGLMRTCVWRLAENQDTDYDPYLHVAICAKAASYTPGSETWAYKTLSLITAGEFADSAEMDSENENYYVCIAKRNITQGGKVLGDEWIDTIRFRDWLKNQIQMNCFNVLVQNAKVPYTDAGIGLIQNAVIAALKEGQANGGIAQDFYDEDGNKTAGYTTTAPLAASLSAEQKKTRNLPDLKWTAYLAGAIHCTEISGTLGY